MRLPPRLEENKCSFLLAALILFYLYVPLTQHRGFIWQGLLSLLSLVTILTSVLAVAGSKRAFRFVVLPAVVAVVIQVLDTVDYQSVTKLSIVAHLALSYVYGATAWLILRYVLTGRRVDADKMVGAVCVYFLIALIFSRLYEIIYFFQPGAFIDGNREVGIEQFELAYFSLVTLTTLGYGDIAPVSVWARSLAGLEAAIGVLFLAVFVARMVGQYRSKDQA